MRDSGGNSENSGSDRLVVRFGPFTLDAGQRRLSRGPSALHLTPKAFDLLRLLAGEAPRVLTKRELHERLWPDSFVTDASLAEVVKEIRRALHDRDRDAPIVRTAHGVGYALSLEVHAAEPPPPAARPPRHWLVVGRRRVALGEGENVIGRDPSADVCLDAVAVSRRHARITVNGPDARLEDLDSKNGTTLGRNAAGAPQADPTPVREAVPLKDGDQLAFGGIAARYRSSTTAAMSTQTRVEPRRRRTDYA